MANKAEVINEATREWRADKDLVGVRLSRNQKEELRVYVDKRWGETLKAGRPEIPDEPLMPKSDVARPCTANLKELGLRTGIHYVQKDVVTGHSDRGPITVVKSVPEAFTHLDGGLTAEEAYTLGSDVEWQSMKEKSGKMTCKAGGRRFVIDYKEYQKLCQM